MSLVTYQDSLGRTRTRVIADTSFHAPSDTRTLFIDAQATGECFLIPAGGSITIEEVD